MIQGQNFSWCFKHIHCAVREEEEVEMSALSDEADMQVKTWQAHAHSAASEAMQALYQCYLTQSYCSQLEKVLTLQRLKMESQQQRLDRRVERLRLLSCLFDRDAN